MKCPVCNKETCDCSKDSQLKEIRDKIHALEIARENNDIANRLAIKLALEAKNRIAREKSKQSLYENGRGYGEEPQEDRKLTYEDI